MEEEINMNQSTIENEKNSKLLKGVVLGGIIGGVVSLVDANTRNSLKETAGDLKTSSQRMLSEVKENPGEVKDQVLQQFKEASVILKEAISDAQGIYERVNADLFSNMGDIKELTNIAMSTVKDAKGEIAQIGSKVAEAGTELKGGVLKSASTDVSANSISDQDSTYITSNNLSSTSLSSSTGNLVTSTNINENTGANGSTSQATNSLASNSDATKDENTSNSSRSNKKDNSYQKGGH
jgi:gas vesicle protein